VTSLDEVTQQNAALVEQASASAHSLLEQAGQLDTMMARYVVIPGYSTAATDAGRDDRESMVA
jgi:methyl-accepting chemotaxis protein